MPKVFRKERIEAEILRIMPQALEGWKQPAIPKERISFTRVELSKDKSYANIYVSIFDPDNDEERAQAVFNTLAKKSGYFRGFIGRQIKIFHTPEVRLIYDKGIRQSVKMQQILDGLNIKHEEDEEEAED
ncbi:MAG TPA: 30S ribosome-binding factor RbfA [Thermotogota bacterium]|nr:30S ribosome-binding factor RbfA [Thermotogota bacterium]